MIQEFQIWWYVENSPWSVVTLVTLVTTYMVTQSVLHGRVYHRSGIFQIYLRVCINKAYFFFVEENTRCIDPKYKMWQKHCPNAKNITCTSQNTKYSNAVLTKPSQAGSLGLNSNVLDRPMSLGPFSYEVVYLEWYGEVLQVLGESEIPGEWKKEWLAETLSCAPKPPSLETIHSTPFQ